MVDIRIIDDAALTATSAPTPALEPVSRNLTIALEDGSEAVFVVPTIKHARMVERSQAKGETLGLSDFCRELGKVCVVCWGDRSDTPSDDEIYASDDQAVVRLFLQEMSGASGQDHLSDQELIDRFLGQVGDAEPPYEVLPDKTHRVRLSLGNITFRRLTRKDMQRVEANAASNGNAMVTGDLLLAVSTCTEWWRSDRAIMPADFEAVPISEFKRVSEALKGFLRPRHS